MKKVMCFCALLLAAQSVHSTGFFEKFSNLIQKSKETISEDLQNIGKETKGLINFVINDFKKEFKKPWNQDQSIEHAFQEIEKIQKRTGLKINAYSDNPKKLLKYYQNILNTKECKEILQARHEKQAKKIIRKQKKKTNWLKLACLNNALQADKKRQELPSKNYQAHYYTSKNKK